VTLRSVVVLGTGLIGTSVALALRARDVRVWLDDRDSESLRLAVSLGAGLPLYSGSASGPSDLADPADLAVIAVPPRAVAPTVATAQERGLARVYTDVASVKRLPVVEATDLGCDMTSYVPAHPLAGRERSGPAAARADLFLGRTWALCPSSLTAPSAVAVVSSLVALCGANEVITDPDSHDRWVALVSHAPHVVSAALAARLEGAPADALVLAGQGLRDTTRIAAGDPRLWLQILGANAGPVAEILAEVAADLAETSRALTGVAEASAVAAASAPPASGSPASSPMPVSPPPSARDIADKTVTDLLERARVGVARIPGKHGEAPRQFALVQVVIRDQPGELARLFNAAGQAGVNIEDIRIEHSPGLPVGAAELSVRPADVAALLAAMEAGGWPARG
jgi:prephenate dehydrogenase